MAGRERLRARKRRAAPMKGGPKEVIPGRAEPWRRRERTFVKEGFVAVR